MLLEFKAQNYRSFKDEFVFSMEADKAKKDLYYSILKESIENKQYNALCSSVIYGPNAAGKSNIIEALDTFRLIVERGHIRNCQVTNWATTPNKAGYQLDLIPNNKQKNKPVKFFIKFISCGVLFEYGLKVDLGNFIDKKYQHKILEEELRINTGLMFHRKQTVKFPGIQQYQKYKEYVVMENISNGMNMVQKTLKEDELFLTNGFKTIFSPKLVDIFTNWMKNKLLILFHSEAYRSSMNWGNNMNNLLILPEYMQNFINEIGLNSNKLCFLRRDENADSQLCSLFNNTIIPAELVESYGTIRLVHLLLPLLYTFINGTVMVADEFDSSLHPMVVMSIINLFHNPDINKNNAQLIFNTHNPIFLNKDLFRRDEIKFVDRSDSQYSELYTLADFPTSGKCSVKTTDYMKNYFVSRYGAIRNIDFTNFFEKMINNSKLKLEITKNAK